MILTIFEPECAAAPVPGMGRRCDSAQTFTAGHGFDMELHERFFQVGVTYMGLAVVAGSSAQTREAQVTIGAGPIAALLTLFCCPHYWFAARCRWRPGCLGPQRSIRAMSEADRQPAPLFYWLWRLSAYFSEHHRRICDDRYQRQSHRRCRFLRYQQKPLRP